MHAIEQYHYLDARREALVPWAHRRRTGRSRSEPTIIAVDAAITGRDRSVDIDYATSTRGQLVHRPSRAGRSVGVVAVAAPTWWNPWHPHGARVGPVMADDADDIAADPRRSAGVADDVDARLPMSSRRSCHRACRRCRRCSAAGFEVVDTDLLMASDDTVIEASSTGTATCHRSTRRDHRVSSAGCRPSGRGTATSSRCPASFGRPSTRSPTMLRMTSSLPPAMRPPGVPSTSWLQA